MLFQRSLLVQGLLTFPVSFFCFLLALKGQEGERTQGQSFCPGQFLNF